MASHAALLPGSTLGAYEILERVGAGGMGEVYRARDTRLGREVAIKLLPGETAADPGHRARFEREARLLAALNHPGIAILHALEEAGGVLFLVQELIPGQSLAERIARGPVPPAEALRIGLDVTRALAAAHAAGIIHRDIKPANVRLRPDGTVKLLDFGIAKLRPAAGTAQADRAPTTESTAPHVLLGSPSYMSPEQVRGLPAEAATDLWGVGCLLYEMLTCRAAFTGATVPDILSVILAGEPDWGALPAGVPEHLRDILIRCLEKAPARRPESAAVLEAEMEAARLDSEAATVPARRAQPRLTQISIGEGIEQFPAWSPDGTELALSGEFGPVRKLVRRRLDGSQESRITGGDHDDLHPCWSPDGGTLVFTRAREAGRRLEPGDVFGAYADADLWALDLATSRERLLVENAAYPAFSPDGRRIAFDAPWSGPQRIWICDANGRNPVQLSTDVSEAVAHIRPRWSPDGSKVVFQNVERTKFDIRWVDVGSRRMEWLTQDLYQDVNPVWAPSGRWVYFTSYRGGGLNLWRIPLRADGAPAGGPEQLTTGPGQDVEVAPSPDGRRLCFTVLRQNADLYKLPVSPESGWPTGPPLKVLATSREESRGAWSPDGRAIAFNSDRAGSMNIWLLAEEGATPARLTEGEGGDYQPSWSPDAGTLAFFSSRNGSPGIWTVGVKDRALTSLSPGGGIEINPFFSPDGTWIAYESDRDGRLEVWRMRPDGSEARPLTQVGVSGHFLRWTRDGAELIFRCPAAGRSMVVPLAGGEPRPLPDVVGGAHMSLSPDGSRILDALAHKALWVSPIAPGAAGGPEKVFEFEDPDVRIDYPVWSPDGHWVLFDRFRPQGGDIWMLEGLE